MDKVREGRQFTKLNLRAVEKVKAAVATVPPAFLAKLALFREGITTGEID